MGRTPDWMDVGTSLWDPEGERWRIREVGAVRVSVQHPDRGVHRLLKEDLLDWVESGQWSHGR